MLGLLGIFLALGVLIFFAYRGYSVLYLAPISALIAVVFAGAPLLASYTQVFMPALGNYVITYFPVFMLGAIFGKIMGDTGAARTIAMTIVRWVGPKRAILATILSGGILTYGGVSLFVVAFALFPIANELFRAAGLPQRLIPAAILVGAATFTMTALPGTPAIQNAIPGPFFGTTTYAAPGLGIIAGIIMFALGTAWIEFRARRLVRAGEGFDDGKDAGVDHEGAGADHGGAGADHEGAGASDGVGTGSAGTAGEDRGTPTGPGTDPGTPTGSSAGSGAGSREAPAAVIERSQSPAASEPSAFIAFLPIIIVIVTNFVLVTWVFPTIDSSYLAQETYGRTDITKVSGIWGIIAALTAAIAVLLVTNLRRLRSAKRSLNEGIMGSLLPIFNTASEVGFGSVIASVPAFTMVRDAVLSVSGNPLISLAVAVNVLAGITGSASGGMSIALDTLGAQYLQIAEQTGINPEIMHRVSALASGGFDSLPHNGAVITLLTICGMTHRQSYKDIFMVSVLVPVIALIAVLILGTLFGSF